MNEENKSTWSYSYDDVENIFSIDIFTQNRKIF